MSDKNLPVTVFLDEVGTFDGPYLTEGLEKVMRAGRSERVHFSHLPWPNARQALTLDELVGGADA